MPTKKRVRHHLRRRHRVSSVEPQLDELGWDFSAFSWPSLPHKHWQRLYLEVSSGVNSFALAIQESVPSNHYHLMMNDVVPTEIYFALQWGLLYLLKNEYSRHHVSFNRSTDFGICMLSRVVLNVYDGVLFCSSSHS